MSDMTFPRSCIVFCWLHLSQAIRVVPSRWVSYSSPFLRWAHILPFNQIMQWRDGSQSIERNLTGYLIVGKYSWVRICPHQILERSDTNWYFSRIFLSYILDLITHSIPNSTSWRVPIVGLQIVWGLILLSGIFVEAYYDQRYDVAVSSTVERPEFLLFVILFGIIVKAHILFHRLLLVWRHIFPKRRDTVSSTRAPSLLFNLFFLVQVFSVCHPSYPWGSFSCRQYPYLGIFSFYVCLC